MRSNMSRQRSTASTVHVPQRENPIVNRLNKTKVEREVDHEQERVERMKKESAVKRAAAEAKVCFVLPVHSLILCAGLTGVVEKSGCGTREATRSREGRPVVRLAFLGGRQLRGRGGSETEEVCQGTRGGLHVNVQLLRRRIPVSRTLDLLKSKHPVPTQTPPSNT